jgi:hypothetical protein
MMTTTGPRAGNLVKALNTFIEDARLAADLGAVLAGAAETGRISYSEITGLVGENAGEALLIGNSLRLLIPTRVEKSGAWEDRLLRCEPGESYELPNVVRLLARNALDSGKWAPVKAVAEAFEEIGEADWQQMPQLVAELGRQSRNYQISGLEIRRVCAGCGLGSKIDLFIAELKAAGIMSPRLSSLAEVSRAVSPLYELNPSLFVRTKGKRETGS